MAQYRLTGTTNIVMNGHTPTRLLSKRTEPGTGKLIVTADSQTFKHAKLAGKINFLKKLDVRSALARVGSDLDGLKVESKLSKVTEDQLVKLSRE